MKTLDEVIKAMEWCTDLDQSGCNACPYVDSDQIICFKEDALHYLKEYRKLDSLDAVAFPEDDNPPLDWSELKQMEGQPVWVEGTVLKSAWYLILEFDVDEDMMFCVGRYYERIPLHGDRMGTYWQAYRKERQ